MEQRLLALEARYGKELQGLQNEKQQLQDLMETQSRLVSQLQGELGSSTLNSTSLQRQQAVLTETVQQLLTKVSQCNGKAVWVHPVWISTLYGQHQTNLMWMILISGHATQSTCFHCGYTYIALDLCAESLKLFILLKCFLCLTFSLRNLKRAQERSTYVQRLY